MYLICDVETSGLPLFGADNPADAPWQPRMASIAAALLDENGIVIDRFDHLIKPTDWPLDNEQFVKNMENAQQIHGLTIERLRAEGVPLMTAHDDWQRLYEKCQYFVAYSAPFDHKIIRGEFKRLGHLIPFRDKQFMCLMKAARPLCGLKKNPKLGEAVQILLGKEHTTAHTAAGDVDVSIELYRYLKERDALVIEDQPEAKVAA